jgi:hypothetical protein
LAIAESTPGQELRAAVLRRKIAELTAPLQAQQAAFVRAAKTLLTPAQQRQLSRPGGVADQVREIKRQRDAANRTAGGSR